MLIFLSEKDISIKKLLEIFKKAYMNASIDNDDDLRVETEICVIYIKINEQNKLLRYTTFFELKNDFSAEEKSLFMNSMNNGVIFARFSFRHSDPNVLVSEYFLPYGEGVAIFNIIEAARLLAKVTIGAIQSYDEKDMVN